MRFWPLHHWKNKSYNEIPPKAVFARPLYSNFLESAVCVRKFFRNVHLNKNNSASVQFDLIRKRNSACLATWIIFSKAKIIFAWCEEKAFCYSKRNACNQLFLAILICFTTNFDSLDFKALEVILLNNKTKNSG